MLNQSYIYFLCTNIYLFDIYKKFIIYYYNKLKYIKDIKDIIYCILYNNLKEI